MSTPKMALKNFASQPTAHWNQGFGEATNSRLAGRCLGPADQRALCGRSCRGRTVCSSAQTFVPLTYTRALKPDGSSISPDAGAATSNTGARRSAGRTMGRCRPRSGLQEPSAIRMPHAYTDQVWLDRGLTREPSSPQTAFPGCFRFVGRVVHEPCGRLTGACIGGDGARLQAEGREGRRFREGAFRQPGLYPVYAPCRAGWSA